MEMEVQVFFAINADQEKAIRITRYTASGVTWYEVETYRENVKRWISRKITGNRQEAVSSAMDITWLR
jgi:predicted RNA-binding Zn ribbon-like protein